MCTDDLFLSLNTSSALWPQGLCTYCLFLFFTPLPISSGWLCLSSSPCLNVSSPQKPNLTNSISDALSDTALHLSLHVLPTEII